MSERARTYTHASIPSLFYFAPAPYPCWPCSHSLCNPARMQTKHQSSKRTSYIFIPAFQHNHKTLLVFYKTDRRSARFEGTQISSQISGICFIFFVCLKPLYSRSFFLLISAQHITLHLHGFCDNRTWCRTYSAVLFLFHSSHIKQSV